MQSEDMVQDRVQWVRAVGFGTGSMNLSVILTKT
jgi:hypothetical protein